MKFVGSNKLFHVNYVLKLNVLVTYTCTSIYELLYTSCKGNAFTSLFFFQNGLYSALPYIGFWGIINISGVLADLAQKCLSATFTRKLFDISGTGIFTGKKINKFHDNIEKKTPPHSSV